MSELSWIRDDVPTVDPDDLRWSLSTLRALTPEGELEDVVRALQHAPHLRAPHEREFVDMFMELLEQERPDLYASTASEALMRCWIDHSPPSLLQLQGHGRGSLRPGSRRLTPLKDLFVFMNDALEGPLSDMGAALPNLNASMANQRVWFWVRSCAHLCVVHRRMDLLSGCLERIVRSPWDEGAAIVDAIRGQVVSSARLDTPPGKIPVDIEELRSFDGLEAGENTVLDETYFTSMMRVLARIIRGNPDAFEATSTPYFINEIDTSTERQKIQRALARAFPFWSDSLEQQALPLDDELLGLMMQGCVDVEVHAPEELERTSTMAWRRLVRLIADSAAMRSYAQLERVVEYVTTAPSVSPLTRCVVGLDVYLDGHVALAALVMTTPPRRAQRVVSEEE